MAKEKKSEQKPSKAINLAREIPIPKSSLKSSSQKTPKKDDEK